MIVRRGTGIAMLAVQAAMLWWSLEHLLPGLLPILVATMGCWPGLQRDWSDRKKYGAAAAVGIAYLLWWVLYLQNVEQVSSGQFSSNEALAAAAGLMMLQALQFFWRKHSALPGFYPLIGIGSMAFAADNYLSDSRDWFIAGSFAMSFGLLMGIFYAVRTDKHSAGESTRWVYRLALLGCCFILSFLLAAGTAWGIGQSDHAIAQWLAARTNMDRLVLGNRPTARLNSMTDIKGQNFDHIALQIVADASPGYLRGQAYSTYSENAWRALPSGEVRPPADEIPEGYARLWQGESLYPVKTGAEVLRDTLVVYPDAAIDRAMFLPANSGWAARATGAIQVNEADVVQAAESLLGQPYQVLTAAPPNPLPLGDDERAGYLALPEALKPRLKELAQSICGERKSTLAKANAITQHFTSNYDYVLGIEVPKGEDPIEYFLFSDPLPDAHCEYFATGAALLLRAAGVPTRYVTGVGVWEQHPFADYWVARNRDSHAWVEAWDGEEGWFIVEATPASGLPEASDSQGTNALRDFWSMVLLNMRRLLSAVKDGAWPTVVDLLRSFIGGVVNFLGAVWWVVLLLVVAFLAVWNLRARLRRQSSEEESEDFRERQLKVLLSNMDRWLHKKHKKARAPHTTLHAFARSLEVSLPTEEGATRLADWYRRWATTRYHPDPEKKDVAALEAELQSVQRRKE